MKKWLFWWCCWPLLVWGQAGIQNPILKGFYPDPSVCRVGDDYYLVTSSFEYFPGIPIFHSRDLAHWQQIGHVLSRPSQLNLDSVRASGGVFAPTIRYHKGVFYVINTLVGKGGNFYVTATNPHGPWSDPKWLPDAPGIDPSLFFDDDGKAYYTGNGRPADNTPESKKRHIWLQQIDLEAGKLVGERKIILVEGALHGASSAEAPHLYKKDGYYYLLIAEGGTGDNHAITIFRSRKIDTLFQGNPKNPILTHRHLGKYYPITCTGHGDLVETQRGEWYVVLLGVRPYGGFHYNLGRETFIAPVIWQDHWPIISPGDGKVLFSYPAPSLPPFAVSNDPVTEHFSADTLPYIWNFLRTPRQSFWSLQAQKGVLRMQLLPERITDLVSPAFLGRRQQDTSFDASCALRFVPKRAGESAGLVVFMNHNFHFRLEKMWLNEQPTIILTKRHAGRDTVLATYPHAADEMILGVSARGQQYSFRVKTKNGQWQTLQEGVDGRTLSRVVTGGFTGAYLGVYATAQGVHSDNYVDVDWFSYEGKEQKQPAKRTRKHP